MGKYCLTKNLARVFKEKLNNGEISPEKLSKMTSLERREFFSGFLGEYNAKNVNALFEKKLLQKNFWNSMIRWAEETTGIKDPIRQDLISRIEKMKADKKGDVLSPKERDDFLNDLASAKIGIDVTYEEARKVAKLRDEMMEARKSYNPDTGEWSNEIDKFKYGKSRVVLQDYIKDLKNANAKFDILNATAGTLKSLLASLDNSFFGRQGIKVLYNRPDIWAKNFVKSFSDIAKTLGKKDAITPIKADIFSRKYAMNGAYERGKVDIGIVSEEAFPSSLPERIPLFGRLYSASEAAYNGAALRMRADMADVLFDNAIKNGVDITEKKEAEALGHLVNSFTGRGSLGKLGNMQKEINVLLFSGKFLKANFDTLTAHQLDKKATPYSKKIAAKNLLKIIGSTSAILIIAEMLHPGSVDKDPRSSDFGKIKIGNTRFDISGGMASMITLASRIFPSRHQGEWGWWSKSSTTGKMKKLEGGYGGTTPVDIIESFMEGKASPAVRLLIDAWNQEFFGGEPWSVGGVIKRSTIPISVQQWQELKKDPNSANDFAAIILESLGISVNNYSPTSFNDWNRKPGKELTQFRDKVGQDEFDKANKKFKEVVDEKINQLKKTNEYKALPEADKQKLITKIKDQEKSKIFKEYNFKYKQDRQSKEDKEKIDNIIKDL